MIEDQPPFSLRKYLIRWMTVPIVLLTALSLAIGFLFTWHEIEEVYDAQLVHNAKVLFQLTEHEIHDDKAFSLGIENAKIEHKYERNLGFRIWYHDNLITQSNNTIPFGDLKTSPGFSTVSIDNQKWRVFVLLAPEQDIIIETSERYDIRYELIIQLMSSQILPAVFFIPLLFFIIWISVSRAIKPLLELSNDVKQRSSDDFTPIQNQSIALEVEPLITALNQLFNRMGDSYQRERQFTDHAAHELRTPLAAMKTQAQVLLRKTKELPEHQDGLNNLLASVERATNLIEQLLSLARIQNEKFPQIPFNLSELCCEVSADLLPKAQAKNIDLSADIQEHYEICGHQESIAILIRNIIDNAIKYTPAGGEVKIQLHKSKLIIMDTGVGINNEDKNRVFERFVRVDKTRQIGSGLGLAIVHWIAQAHHFEITLHDHEPQGLEVHIHFSRS